jgi:uncharacterized membrane protein
MKPILRLPSEATGRIADAVAAAEQRTSAEVKVVVLGHCWTDIRTKAKALFYKYELHNTKDRNAVMILLVLANREFLVYGDKGIHERAEEGFWLRVRDSMQKKLFEGQLVEGILAGVEQVCEQLVKHFPRVEHDVNEISDEVVHED